MALDPQDLGDLIAIRDAGTLSAAEGAPGSGLDRVAALEAALGLRLVDRRTDGVPLSQEGLAIAEAAAAPRRTDVPRRAGCGGPAAGYRDRTGPHINNRIRDLRCARAGARAAVGKQRRFPGSPPVAD